MLLPSLRARPQSAASAVHLRCDGLENPLGIDVAKPELSWQMRDDRQSARQTAYEILVASSPAVLDSSKPDIWDSGKVQSGKSLFIEYGGPALQSRQRYYWAVRIWDAGGARSALSAPAWWEMGLLNASDWKAQWINRTDAEFAADRAAGVKWIWLAGENAIGHAPKGVRYFRYTLDLSAVPKDATLLVSGNESMTASVNGITVAESKTWGTFYDTKIQDHLKTGSNTILVTVTSEGGTAGMAALLNLTRPNGEIERIPSDARWQASASPDSGFAPAAVVAELGAQPIGDPWPPERAGYFRKTFTVTRKIERARLYATALGSYHPFLNGKRVGSDILTPGWTDYRKRIQYQTYDVTDLIAPGTNSLGAVLGDGWYASGLGWHLQRFLFGPPPLRLLVQLEIEYSDGTRETIASDGTWRASTGPILSSEIYAGESYDGRLEVPWDSPGFDAASWPQVQIAAVPAAKLVAQRDQPIQHTQTLTPQAITSPEPGVYVFDMGQNMVGVARLKANGPKGTSIRLRYAEILKADGNIYRENLRSAKATDTFVLAGGGEEVFEPSFTYHGFRYIEVTGYPGKPGLEAITGIVFHSDMPETGRFETSSALVNQLWHNILWGQRGNLMSVPTDCPQRDERLGWMADAQIFWRTASYNMNMDAFANKWLRDIRDAQLPDGAFTDVAPRVVDDLPGAPAWGDAGVIIPWTTWQQYGDLRVVAKNWDAMKKWLAYIQSANPDYIWRNARGNDYGDWVPAHSYTPKRLLATAFWAYDAELMSQMAAALGNDSDAAAYRDLYAKIKAAFIAQFVQNDGTVGNGSQTCYVLALHMNLLPDNLRQAAADKLVADIQARGGHLSTGFIGTSFLMPVLSEAGKSGVAYTLLLNETYPSWGYMISKGATTMWERWNGDTGDPSMNSFNHYAFGAVGQWLYGALGGIRSDPAAPGFKRILIDPHPDPRLSHVYSEYDSPYGPISTNWSLEPGKPFTLKVTIPANTSAVIHVPANESSRVTAPSNGLTYSGRDKDSAIYQAGAGTYSFEVN
jgi:alpha-L-rhamnosidase